MVNDNAQGDQSPKQDIYARITAKIVATLEDCVRLWSDPGTPNAPLGALRDRCVTTANHTAGINALSLRASAMDG